MSNNDYQLSMFGNLSALEQRIHYSFANTSLLAAALTHSSWANEHDVAHNERLEYLGDAVLELIITHEIYLRYPQYREGAMTSLRSRLVSEDKLVEIAHDLDVGSFLLIGKGEEIQGGRERASLLADAIEAIIGAVFLDGGYEAATNVITSLYASCWSLSAMPPKIKDYKTRLQELTQALLKSLPVYTQVQSRGPEHAKEFLVRLELSNGRMFQASGCSIKKAEQNAAKMALIELKQIKTSL